MSYISDVTLYPDCESINTDCGYSVRPNSTIMFIGDSWISGNHFVHPFYYHLNANYPFAGVGYVPVDSYPYNLLLSYYPTDPTFSDYLDPEPDIYEVTRTSEGTWTDTVRFIYSPNLMSTTSFEPGATKTITCTATDFTIYYFQQPGGGSFSYSIDSGAPVMVSTAAAAIDLGTVVISNESLAGHTVSMSVTSAGTKGVTLFGVDCEVADSGGIRVDKLGMSGSSASNWWNRVSPAIWISDIAQLSPDVVIITLGTNDILKDSAATYINAINRISAYIGVAVPDADIILAPPVSGARSGPAGDVSAYYSGLQALAMSNGYGYIEASNFFGSYNEALENGLWSDTAHLSPVGDQLFADILIDYLGLGNSPVITGVIGLNQQNVAGGGRITIHGEHFVDGAAVTIGGIAAAEVIYISPEMLVAVAPAHTDGFADVQVTNFIRMATFDKGLSYVDIDLLTLHIAIVSGSILTLYYHEVLDVADPSVSALFTVQVNGTLSVGIRSAEVNGNAVTLLLDSPVVHDDIVLVSYTDPGASDDICVIQNIDGVDAPGFSGYLACNGVLPDSYDIWLPVSEVDPIGSGNEITAGSACIMVTWSGSDTGSGIASYNISVSDNGGAYVPWLVDSALTQCVYVGESGHSYAFYSKATDNARNLESAPATPDLVVHVASDADFVDTAAPRVTGFVLPADGEYVVGDLLDITVVFSETVVVVPDGFQPVIRLMAGSREVDAICLSGNGTDALTFRCVVPAGVSDHDGIGFGGEIVPRGALIRDIAGNRMIDLTFDAGSTDGIRIDLPPSLTKFSAPVEQAYRNTQVTVSFSDLLTEGDEADTDGSVDAFLIRSVTSGSLLIGTDALSATPFDALTNYVVDTIHKAFWTPGPYAHGVLDAFTVVAMDDRDVASVAPVQVTVAVMNAISGTASNDNLTGGSVDDELYGYEGSDTLSGYAGNDLIDGGTGADRMDGGAGDDLYVVDNAGDIVVESARAGTDTVQSVISYTLGANVENLSLTGSDAINGKGNVLNNVITGNEAANALNGVTGADTIAGGGGNDTINGGTGVDVMTGGTGDDLFVFDYLATSESGAVSISRDIITDFVSGHDRLDLSAIDANVRVTGNQSFDSTILPGESAFTGAGQLRFDHERGMLFGNTDSNLLTAEITIELAGVTNLLVGDLVY